MSDQLNRLIDELREIIENLPGKEDREYTQEVALSVFKKIEQLEPLVYDASGFMMRDAKLNKVLVAVGKPACKYIEHVLRDDKDRNMWVHAVDTLGEIGEQAIDTLSNAFFNNKHEEIRIMVAIQLLKINQDSRHIVTNELASENENRRLAAVYGITGMILQSLYGGKYDENCKSSLDLLLPYLYDSNHRIRERVLDLLISIKRQAGYKERENEITSISENEFAKIIDNALDDDVSSVRETALRGLELIEINPTNAYMLVKVFEDASGEISNKAIKYMFYGFLGSRNIDPEIIANSIFDELIVRVSNRPIKNFNPEVVGIALSKTFEQNPRLYSQTLERLCDIAYRTPDNGVRRRCIFVAKRINESEFVALVNERANENPKIAKEILTLLGHKADIDTIADHISKTDPGDIQGNAANQIQLLNKYHEHGLEQAKTSFKWAIIFNLIGLVCLVIALFFLIYTRAESIISIITAVGSVTTEFIAGSILYIYNQTRKQLTYYHQQMNQTQRFLLANSLIESLPDDAKVKIRIELVKVIASSEPKNVQLISPPENK